MEPEAKPRVSSDERGEWELTDEELDRSALGLSTSPCKTFQPCGCMSGPCPRTE